MNAYLWYMRSRRRFRISHVVVLLKIDSRPRPSGPSRSRSLSFLLSRSFRFSQDILDIFALGVNAMVELDRRSAKVRSRATSTEPSSVPYPVFLNGLIPALNERGIVPNFLLRQSLARALILSHFIRRYR
jgi:hypothetical protein